MMTDNELAEKTVMSHSVKAIREQIPYFEFAEQMFLEGLREGRKLEWHNLRENPSDLPPTHSTVLDENGDKVEYIGYGKWQVYSEYYEKYVEIDKPVAWCELPEFNEE